MILARCSIAVVGALVSAAGCTNYHIGRLKDVSLEKLRVADAIELGKYPHASNPAATEALIAACVDDDAAIRYFAIGSLANHFPQDKQIRMRLLNALVDRLDDGARGAYSIFFLPLMPIGMDAITPRVRSEAYQVLSIRCWEDFGLDQEAWRRYFEESDYGRRDLRRKGEEGDQPIKRGAIEPVPAGGGG